MGPRTTAGPVPPDRWLVVSWPRAVIDDAELPADLDQLVQPLPADDEWACELLYQLSHVIAPDRFPSATWQVVHAPDAWAALQQG